jgi:(1->4)-alpha-D-glucan 1-alpha-D-glucosylmutase
VEAVPLRIPTATYRLQFNRRFTFRDALSLIDYLEALGISEVYASPLTAARPGSPHGYDVIDPTRLNPELGSEKDFEAFTNLLASRGMGLILDVVPNHMCAMDPGNRWWQHVLERGPSSPFAKYFDIDFHPAKIDLSEKILLPILGDQFGRVVENQEIQVHYDRGQFHARYGDQHLPLSVESWGSILASALEKLALHQGRDNLAFRNLDDVLLRVSQKHAPYEEQREAVTIRLRALFDDGNGSRQALAEALTDLNGRRGDPKSFDALEALLVQQPYRVCFWRVAADEINYRRFFDINDLVAIRVEEPEVFRAVHDLVLRLVREKRVTGLRIDHLDGLFDPVHYLGTLRGLVKEAGADSSFLILVEKILDGNERLDPAWPADGTTGYDFVNVLNGLFVEPKGAELMAEVYEGFTRRHDRAPEVIYRSKRLILGSSMAGELHVLALRLDRISEQHRWSRDFTLKSLEGALAEVIACFPVYRTYVDGNASVRTHDRSVIQTAIAQARGRNAAMNESIFKFIEEVMLLEGPEGLSPGERADRVEFIRRFQQLTGPVMAKGLEDTACYRRYPLASVCEVGGYPDSSGTRIPDFHEFNRERQARWPRSLSATSTHDTKRGEDVRARINVLTEIPEEWSEALQDWKRRNEHWKGHLGSRQVPDANEEYLIYQTLLGTYPRWAPKEEERAQYERRLGNYFEKAFREARLHSSWISPNLEYESAVRKFVHSILSPDHTFLGELERWVERIALPSLWNTLAQSLLKITSPGIPDFYQGSEFMDLRLADPDNRQPVEFAPRHEALSRVSRRWREDDLRDVLDARDEDRLKMFVIRQALRARHRNARLFAEGEYRPLEVGGPAADRIVAFSRRGGGKEMIVAVGRFLAFFGDKAVSGAPWTGTWIQGQAGARYRNVLTGDDVQTTGELELSRILRPLPLCLLEQLS